MWEKWKTGDSHTVALGADIISGTSAASSYLSLFPLANGMRKGSSLHTPLILGTGTGCKSSLSVDSS